MDPKLVPIVEGQSEVESVPVLLRRLLALQSRHDVQVIRPIRTGRYKVVRTGELERACLLALRRIEGCDAILILLDADDDCPKALAPDLLRRAQAVCGDTPVAVVLAKREFEAWFLASLDSLRGRRGLAADVVCPANPEEIRDAKGYLTQAMLTGRTYVEVDDQPALAHEFDVQLTAQRCPSFDKLVRDVSTLVAKMKPVGQADTPNP
jgi:hypothetical protein